MYEREMNEKVTKELIGFVPKDTNHGITHVKQLVAEKLAEVLEKHFKLAPTTWVRIYCRVDEGHQFAFVYQHFDDSNKAVFGVYLLDARFWHR